MAGSFVSKVRLFPSLILVASLALGLRTFDIYAGISLLGEAAVAQDAGEQQDNAEQRSDAQTDDATAAANNQPQRRAPLVVGLPDSEEMEIILQLRERRELLEERGRQIELQGQLLASTEKRIDDKILQLQVLETKIKEHLRLFDEREDGQLKSIVEVYEKMKPKDAAPRFEKLPLQTQLDLVTRMKSAKVAALMEKMSPDAATDLTEELATRGAPPSIEEVQRGS